MTHQTGQPGPSETGDPAADAILSSLQGVEDGRPDEEFEAYQAALDSLAQLLEDQPRLPGLS